jgi:MFS family permease
MATLTGRRPNRFALPLLLLVVVLVGLAVVGNVAGPAQAESEMLTLSYLVFLVITVFVVRRVALQPGPWLGRRLVRRGIVVLTLLACAVMVALPPAWLGGTVILLLLFIALCNVLLGRATEQIAVSGPRDLDERQGSVLDRAYRSAYWVLATGGGVVVGVTYLASPASRGWLASAIIGSPLLVFIALMICLPTMIVAWLEPDRTMPAPRATPAHLLAVRLAMAMVAVTLLAPIAGAAGVELLPVTETALVRTASLGETGSRCANFQRSVEVGVWFSAYFSLNTEICANGKRAHYLWGINPTDCQAPDSTLVSISTANCVSHTDSDGTLYFRYAAWVRPDVLSFLRRRVVLSLAVDREGQVVRAP